MDHPRGFVSFTAQGKIYNLRFSTNEICALEHKFDCSIQKLSVLLSDVENLRISQVRTVFSFGLSDANGPMSEALAGDIMSEIGIAETGDLIGRAFSAAFPKEANKSEAGGAEHPN